MTYLSSIRYLVAGLTLFSSSLHAQAVPDGDLVDIGVAPYGSPEHPTWLRLVIHPLGGYDVAQKWLDSCQQGRCMSVGEFLVRNRRTTW